MEDTLRVGLLQFLLVLCCLNPCFNGRYSQSNHILKNPESVAVLILVLMEDTLRVAVTEDNVMEQIKS